MATHLCMLNLSRTKTGRRPHAPRNTYISIYILGNNTKPHPLVPLVMNSDLLKLSYSRTDATHCLIRMLAQESPLAK
jgi:hypothetical protein